MARNAKNKGLTKFDIEVKGQGQRSSWSNFEKCSEWLEMQK